MKVFVKIKPSEAIRLARYVKAKGIRCCIETSRPNKSTTICKIEVADEYWSEIKNQIPRSQLVFDYYEDNEYIAPPFKKVSQGY